MKIATFNVNGIKTRMPNLLQWLEREQPDVACLQELKALDGMFPHAPLARGRLSRGVEGTAVVERRGHPGARHRPGGDPP